MPNDKQNLYERLRAAGYSDDDATRIVSEAPASRPPEKPQALAAPADLSADVGQAVGVIVPVLVSLLRQWIAHRNLTPGQHPATQQALDQLQGLVQPKEGQSDAAAR